MLLPCFYYASTHPVERKAGLRESLRVASQRSDKSGQDVDLPVVYA